MLSISEHTLLRPTSIPACQQSSQFRDPVQLKVKEDIYSLCLAVHCERA
jgi:hypothetical protein